MPVLLSVLTWTAITLSALAWIGQVRQRMQGAGLAARFRGELRRRGLFDAEAART